ncbi:Phospholipase D1 [Dissophora globulifera]|uniref:Phospholipase n=1 Tax=Dissophora globulifera TaxID=979702 RepID=A0A9P6RS03_9FUNG|nr:Phospholipase D1 [Dissophora globulifera]
MNAVEKFMGMRKKTFSPTHHELPSHQQLLSASSSTAAPLQHQHIDGENENVHDVEETHHHLPTNAASDNPFDFDFRMSRPKWFLTGHRKSTEAHRPSLPNPELSAGQVATPLTEDDRRMLQLRSVFSKLFKRKKDKKGKGAQQPGLEAEDYQLYKNIAPLVYQPSALFMGLSFMIEDKGSALSDRNTEDWNMNVILALVKVVILPYTYTSKDTKIKNRDRSTEEKIPKGYRSAKDKEDKEAREQKRFLIIKVQYGDYLPSWLIERSVDDFVRLYESYHPPIPEPPPMLYPTLKVPKPPVSLRPRFGLTTRGATMNEDGDGDAGPLTEQEDGQPDGVGADNKAPIDNAFDAKLAPTLTRELQTFLQDMIRYAMYLPDAERICKFLELSALTLAHVPDGGYQGKEGYLNVVKQNRLMDEGPLTNAVKKVYRKPVSKYFVVRDSFIITEIQDVILLDASFRANKSPRHLHAPHTFDIVNSELKFHVRAKSDHRRRQFVESIRKMPSLWKEQKRFNSFAPVRRNVSAQWLVDGRDYFWNVSKAIDMAKETIYILDWMLSPEILLRRHQRDGVSWALKDVLARKANEGVKIYIVMYSEVDAAMHLASLRAKKLLRKLNPENILVQRHGPNLKTAWWAHHEKLVVIDNMIAFIGGLDLCFGRWDTAEHTLVDMVEESEGDGGQEQEDGEGGEALGPRWPGQDYSNPRIKDFCDLSKPDVDQIDRAENPRMPWHDVGLQILGQPARDVARHFIQRWNFLCRTKPKQQKIPFLLPKPDIHLSKLKELKLQGTCELQILRSVSSWSIGVKEPECSILTAYIAAIERAEHFIYIENQFFITSTNVNKTIVHNGIGRALTDRIIKAHKAGEKFRVIVVLPLVPGFEGGINTPAATSVRMVMLSIYETICHGKNSIYGRLTTAGVARPQKYISFFGLRNWAKFGEKFVTEQVYIHAKMMIVDDRIAIIGSANINERSMLGNRDSEIAAVVRDQDYIDSTMNGVPYKVSRFAHTLRMNLMMEHLGVPVGHSHSNSNSSHPQHHHLHPESRAGTMGAGTVVGEDMPFSELDFVDPIHPAFIEDIWKHHAESNTLIFRDMFKCIPDNTVKSWSDYMSFNAQSNIEDPRIKEERTLKDKAIEKILGPTMGEHFRATSDNSDDEEDGDDDDHKPSEEEERDDGEGHGHVSRGHGSYRSKFRLRMTRDNAETVQAKKALAEDDSGSDEDPVRDWKKDEKIIQSDPSSENLHRHYKSNNPKNNLTRSAKDLRTDEKVTPKGKAVEKALQQHEQDEDEDEDEEDATKPTRKAGMSPQRRDSVKRTASALAETNDLRLAMESDLSKVQGHLVEWPLDFLRDEIESYNFCYPKDYNHPIDLYT